MHESNFKCVRKYVSFLQCLLSIIVLVYDNWCVRMC